MGKSLDISKQLSLPLSAATRTTGILAKKGAGKSNAAAVMAEAMYDAGIPFVVVDPKGDWFGIRSSASGKGAGLPVPVFGGRHGDIPLEATAGNLVADLINDKALSCVLDVSEFSKADQRKFLIAFGERLYRNRPDDAEVVHLFLEEAHEYLPQRVMRDEAMLVNVWGRIVKQGRFRGIGVTLISQRSASLNKDVLTQIDTLIVLRNTAPQDRKAILAWVEEHDVAKDLVSSLPELKDGEAWVWSPEFLKTTKRIQFYRRSTFDSGATPEVGKSRRAPATLADVDLAEIKEQMADTIEKAKATDPKELKRRITELEQQLAKRPKEKVVEIVKEPYVPPEAVKAVQLIDRAIKEWQNAASKALALLSTEVPETWSDMTTPRRPARVLDRERTKARGGMITLKESAPPEVDTADIKLGKGERTVLQVLAQWPNGKTQNEVAFLAGYSAGASTIGVILSNLRKAGYVEPGQPIRLTPVGVDVVGGYVELPSGKELLDYWLNHKNMGKGERVVLNTLVDSYPEVLTHEELCLTTGYSPEASTMGVILSNLRKLGLVQKGARALTAEFAEAVSL